MIFTMEAVLVMIFAPSIEASTQCDWAVVHPRLQTTCRECLQEEASTCVSCAANGFDCQCSCVGMHAPRKRVGIIGGSISEGNEYGRMLTKRSHVDVVNRAVRATGVVTASLWLDELIGTDQVCALVPNPR